MQQDFYCYILSTDYPPHSNYTYNGFTNNLARRIRQHNGEIKGGAKYTKKYGKNTWKYIAYLTGFPDKIDALQCEWRIKHPDNRRRRSRKYLGPEGRLIGLREVLQCKQWTSKSKTKICELNLKLYVRSEYLHLFNKLPENIEVYVIEE